MQIDYEFRTPTDETSIEARVKKVLIDLLGVSEEEVKPNARIIGDLGAESLDYLDMIYRLEEKFDIKFPQENLSPIYSGFLMNRRNGIKLSDDEINSIAASYPHLNINRLRVDRTVN